MQFKVGDRVEVLEPADGLIGGRANNLGLGIVEDVDAFQVRVKVEANDQAWWYDIKSVRPLIPAGATTIKQEDPPTTVADLTIPSITVGTQVRLTGVTMSSGKDGEVVTIESDGFVFGVPVGALEVIRQPFKRGEVVYSKISATNEEPYVVLNDESLGMVDVTCCRTGFYIANDNSEAYERRP